MKWFKEVFLPSFKIGKEIEISEKQFRIFEDYLEHSKETGYTYIVYGNVDNLHIEACKWSCLQTYKYYVTIKQLQ